MSRRFWIGPATILLLMILSFQPALADRVQDSDVLVYEVNAPLEMTVDFEETATYHWLVYNNGTSPYFLDLGVDNPDPDFKTVVTPDHGLLGPSESLTVTLNVTAPDEGAETTVSIQLVIRATDVQTGRSYSDSFWTNTTLTGAPPAESPEGRILGIYDNPLPPPFNTKWAAFLVSILIWMAFGGIMVAIVHPTIRARAKKSKTEIDDMALEIIEGPLLVLIIVYGAVSSIEILDLPRDLVSLLDRIFAATFIMILTWLGYKVFKNVLVYYGSILAERTETDVDDRLIPVFEKIGAVVIILLGVISVVQALGYDVTLFLVGFGAIGLILGLALKDSLSNFFSGIQILADAPFRKGDLIVLEGGQVCRVEWIGMRSTKLYNMKEHNVIVMPNNNLANRQVINIVKPDVKYRVRVDVGVAYGTDIQKVKRVLMEIVKSHPNVLKGDRFEPTFRLLEFGDSSINVRAIFWVDDVLNQWRVASEIREEIDRRFREEGIEIPFPQRDVWIKKTPEQG